MSVHELLSSLPCWQILTKSVLESVCLSSRGPGWKTGMLVCCIREGSIWAESRGKHSGKEEQTWITSCLTHLRRPNALDVMQSYSFQMWVSGVLTSSWEDWIRIIAAEVLGLSVKSRLAGVEENRAFVTAHRGAASHHGKGWQKEQKALSTGAPCAIITMFTVNVSSSMPLVRSLPERTVRKFSFRSKPRITR